MVGLVGFIGRKEEQTAKRKYGFSHLSLSTNDNRKTIPQIAQNSTNLTTKPIIIANTNFNFVVFSHFSSSCIIVFNAKLFHWSSQNHYHQSNQQTSEDSLLGPKICRLQRSNLSKTVTNKISLLQKFTKLTVVGSSVPFYNEPNGVVTLPVKKTTLPIFLFSMNLCLQ